MKIELVIRKLSVRRGGRALFGPVSAVLAAGEALAVTGDNGVGKTSLLRTVAGFLPPFSGVADIVTDGVPAAMEDRGVLTGWLGASDGLKPQMTVEQTLAFARDLSGSSGDCNAALVQFGLAAARALPVYLLSAGQKRRLALARLVLTARPLWLLDEPFTLLDAAGKQAVRDAVAAHLATGGLVAVATHEPLGLPCRTLRLQGRP